VPTNTHVTEVFGILLLIKRLSVKLPVFFAPSQIEASKYHAVSFFC